MLEELNVQSALEAERGAEERVRDALVEKDKMPLVVREAALIELWREEIMPRILKAGEPETCFQVGEGVTKTSKALLLKKDGKSSYLFLVLHDRLQRVQHRQPVGDDVVSFRGRRESRRRRRRPRRLLRPSDDCPHCGGSRRRKRCG